MLTHLSMDQKGGVSLDDECKSIVADESKMATLFLVIILRGLTDDKLLNHYDYMCVLWP